MVASQLNTHCSINDDFTGVSLAYKVPSVPLLHRLGNRSISDRIGISYIVTVMARANVIPFYFLIMRMTYMGDITNGSSLV